MYYIYKPVYVHFFSVISWSILIHDKLKSSLCLSTFHDYCRAYLSTDDVFPNDDSGIVALLNSEDLESKACVVKDTASPILPTQAMQAFRLLNENTAAQVPFYLSLIICFYCIFKSVSGSSITPDLYTYQIDIC